MPFNSDPRYAEINEWLFGSGTTAADNYISKLNDNNFSMLFNSRNSIAKAENKFSFGTQSDIDFGDLTSEEVKAYLTQINDELNAIFHDVSEEEDHETNPTALSETAGITESLSTAVSDNAVGFVS